MGVYYFVAASLLAVIPILGVFKVVIGKIQENPAEYQQGMQRFILFTALIEVLPILLIILGFMRLEQVQSITELYLPAAIIIFSYIFAMIFISLQRMNDAEIDTRQFRVIALALVGAIPIVSIVAIFLMLP